MYFDCDAVGGFTEDLPVLAIVISGVVLLMATAGWVGDALMSEETSRALELEVQEIADRFVLFLTSRSDDLPLVESIRAGRDNLSIFHPDDEINCIITVIECFPECEVLQSIEHSDGGPVRETAFATRYINALDRYNRVAMLEVRVLEW
ncbi:MAG: hypothetical protein KKE24_01105 [Candidatus Thermoplasmatota archaeon]|nr:hypothetical protein [Candidatus Thermoplasmatota archaeon]